ncbi:CheY-like chemotaxis protein/signal transduction histidine kinase/CHASE3 domain sensor protein [Pedobacter africanus]|uniref:CheY-like chemotaxis protein/signal transduction histidine kinase/CHASE3 domain sensor protein n=1 Tax=Pedobacter africanus TaxID=151894 RepID=A0ACC6KYF8_9SPHI|nr:response regulator [Pedobacter africanus]MDR6784217.1 CheY-like chemotaxis protein/signal transduction histidine kinase/CHASE3 domain sensor protein [Pedobacter africanus]
MFKLTFKQQVLTGFAVSLLFVLISAVTSYQSIDSFNEDSDWENHTYEIIILTQKIDQQIVNAESGLRGFVLTQNQKYLPLYTANIDQVQNSIHDLKSLVSDNPVQLRHADSLESYLAKRVSSLKEILHTNNTSGKDAAIVLMQTDKIRAVRENLSKYSEKMVFGERTLLKKRIMATDKSKDRTVAIVIGSALVIFCLILFLFTYIRRTFDQQKETEAQIRNNNAQLAQLSEDNKQKNWLLSGAALINEAMRGEQEMKELSTRIITEICNYLKAPVGALFLSNENQQTLHLTGGYAYRPKKGIIESYAFGEGMVGQTAAEKKEKILTDLPADYMTISSGLGQTPPKSVYLFPVLFEDTTIAVIEIGLTGNPDDTTSLFLQTVSESIGVAINSTIARLKLRDLFEETQQQAEELESQQEELRTTNEELIYKSEQLQASEEELRVQQEELRQTNAELEEKAQQLEERNIAINQAKEAMSLKAEELEISSKYKSEFLANMSHELRTPLNSILILARILKENRPENLNEDQIKYAGVIHNAGTDLLTLINDILDLSKIESGKLDLSILPLKPAAVKQNMEALFTELARSKKITFRTVLDQELPKELFTDQARLEQIVKNLLSNAFKFTPEHGEITLEIGMAKPQTTFYSSQLQSSTDEIIAIRVKDSGIGIPEDKQKLIFEAFQQADGSTSRKYGGTGLGLSISKELAHILGGEIQVSSKQGEGSIFTLFVPKNHSAASENEENTYEAEETAVVFPVSAQEPLPTPQGRTEIQKLLIVEDDLAFADVLNDYAIEKGFSPILAHSGDVALELAFSELPDAIVLDIMLPVVDGWTILKKLKADPRTKNIPVHMMSAGNEKAGKAKKEGAIGFLKKPIEKEQLDEAFELLSAAHLKYNLNTVLVIEDQELHSKVLTQQLTEKGVDVKQAFTGKEALELLEEQEFDCIILDLKLPDISGFELLDMIKSQPRMAHVPVIINTAMELDQEKMAHIMQYTEAMVLKSNKSNDRLIDEVSLFMNKLKQESPASSAAISKSAKPKGSSTMEKVLKDKTILITDDDMRNIFALSSALQAYDLKIVIANNGREAITRLEEQENIDLVLMDIMMPEMDGYEAMRAIRAKKEYAKLPIIALTAKAMKNDREKCIEAGANDYISKPVDMDKLLSMLRVWLS